MTSNPCCPDDEDLAEEFSALTVQQTTISEVDSTLPQNRIPTSSQSTCANESSSAHGDADVTAEPEPEPEAVEDLDCPLDEGDQVSDDLPFTSTLNACEICGGHHYTFSQCIYKFDYTTYLTYHALYLASLPHNLDVSVDSDESIEGDGLCTDGELSDVALWQRARDLDIETKGVTKLKEELLTQSGRDALADGEIWKERLTEESESWQKERDMLEEWKKTGGRRSLSPTK